MFNLKRSFSLVSLSIVILFAESVGAYVPQRGNVNATLGPYVYKTVYSGIREQDNEGSTGLSLVANGDVSDHGSLEMAAIYMNKYYFRDDAGRSISEKTQVMHITIGYRRYWAPSFSTSVAVYTNYPMGETETIHTDFTDAENMFTSARANSESGLDLGLQGEIWNSGRYSVMAEFRYSYSIGKKSHEFADQYGGTIGLRYFIQSHVAKPKELNPKK